MPNPTPQSLHIPDITGMTTIQAAYAYTRAGWYIGPVTQGTKNPGSILGKNWTHKTTRDPEIIADTWMYHNHGIFLHVGRSGAIVLDIDTPTNLPDILTDALTTTPAPFQYTRKNDLARRHYIYKQPEGCTFGNGLGRLPTGWGDIRGTGGVIIVAPSTHPDPDGHYQWGRTGEIPTLPTTIADQLTPTTNSPVDVATDQTIRNFFALHTVGQQIDQAHAWVKTFQKFVREGDSRHQRAISILTGGLKEAAAGYYPAHLLEENLREAFLHAATQHGKSAKQGKARTPAQAVEEWRGILAWAVAQANNADLGEVFERAETHAPTRGLDQYTTQPTTPKTEPANGEGEVLEGEIVNLKTGEITTPTPPPAQPTSALDKLLNPTTNNDDEDPPTWAPLDLTPILNGTYTPPTPTILTTTTNHSLLYPQKVHSIYGESESGKSWLAQYATTETLNHGGRAIYIDFESDAPDIIHRLHTLGTTREQLASPNFAYIHPETSPHTMTEQPAFHHLLNQPADLIILDGVTEALTLEGKSSLDNDEITQWMRLIPRRLARATGAAVVLIDHVIKNSETRGRYAIGAQAKLAAIDGAAYLVEPITMIGPGHDGILSIKVTKDRPGRIREYAAAYAKTNRTQEAARLHIDSTSDTMHATLEPPQQHDIPVDKDGNFKPTYLMESISKILNTMREPISLRKLLELLKEKGSGAKTTTVTEAINLLVEQGYALETEGLRGARMFRSAGTYAARNDPASDSFAGDLEQFETT